MEMCSRSWRTLLKLKLFTAALGLAVFSRGGWSQGTVRITLDQAIQMALRHNHTLLAARTTVQQSHAQEITANLRPNPTLFVNWAYLPLYKPEDGYLSYLQNNTEGDMGLSYTIERGNKRFHRLQAAKDATDVARSQVNDNERTTTAQVATLFINAQLADSTMELTQQNL